MRLTLLIASCAVLWSMESIRPLRRYEPARLWRATPNLVLTAILLSMNALLSMAVAVLCGNRPVGVIDVVAGIAALDLAAYIAHVLLHQSALGWRFHRVHH